MKIIIDQRILDELETELRFEESLIDSLSDDDLANLLS
jgi:hypothetical protein